MKNLSAAQLELELTDNRSTDTNSSASTGKSGDTVIAPVSRETTDFDGGATTSLRPPRFGNWASIYAITSRQAGRVNALRIPERERQDLLRERQALLDKKFAGQITKRESNRLEYVRWSLDRIEDARHGEELDRLDAAVSDYERARDALTDLHRQLTGLVDEERRHQQRSRRR
jgi:hypothetical protein